MKHNYWFCLIVPIKLFPYELNATRLAKIALQASPAKYSSPLPFRLHVDKIFLAPAPTGPTRAVRHRIGHAAQPRHEMARGQDAHRAGRLCRARVRRPLRQSPLAIRSPQWGCTSGGVHHHTDYDKKRWPRTSSSTLPSRWNQPAPTALGCCAAPTMMAAQKSARRCSKASTIRWACSPSWCAPSGL